MTDEPCAAEGGRAGSVRHGAVAIVFGNWQQALWCSTCVARCALVVTLRNDRYENAAPSYGSTLVALTQKTAQALARWMPADGKGAVQHFDVWLFAGQRRRQGRPAPGALDNFSSSVLRQLREAPVSTPAGHRRPRAVLGSKMGAGRHAQGRRSLFMLANMCCSCLQQACASVQVARVASCHGIRTRRSSSSKNVLAKTNPTWLEE